MALKDWFQLNTLISVLFILVVFGDIASTIMALDKHGEEFEVNPMKVIGVPLWVMFIIKIVVMGGYFVLVHRYYNKFGIYLRYFVIYFFVLFTIINLSATLNNIDLYNMEGGTIQPIPQEMKVEVYNEQINNMKLIGNLVPSQEKVGFKIPMIILLVVYQMFSFAVWVSYEKRWGFIQ